LAGAGGECDAFSPDILSITIGALLLLNSVGSQSSYLAADTLNPQRLSSSLARCLCAQSIRSGRAFCADAAHLYYRVGEAPLDRSFAHTERMLVLLSGVTALLLLGEYRITSCFCRSSPLLYSK